MERRFVPNREVRVVGGDGKPSIISGYGAVFYDGTPETEYVLWDDRYGRAVERILPGAFDAVLAKPDDVRGLFNHDANMVLGRNKAGTMRLGVDSVGLEYQIEAGDTQIARDVMQHISRGDVNGSSFSFSLQPDGQVWTITGESDGKTNELREIKAVSVLYDVGPVTFPAYVGATSSARDSSELVEARSARDAWYKANPKIRYNPPIGIEAARTKNLDFSLDALRIGI